MRTLVTGGAGFIGSHLAEALLRSDHEVAVIDDLSTGRREHVPREAQAVFSDVASEEARAFLLRWQPQAVFHLAAKVSLRESVEDPAGDARTNVLGSIALLETCRRVRDVHVVFASTGGGIYGEAARYPTPESEPVAPLSPYGCAKAAAEAYLGYYRRMHRVTSCALRYGNVYGPRQDAGGEAGVIAIFASRCLRGEALTIHGDGSQSRDYVYVEDVVEANLACLRVRAQGVFNVGTGVETTVAGLERRVQVIAGTSVPVVNGPERLGDARRSCLDSTLLRSAVGWKPHTSLASGLARTIAWFRKEMAA